MRGMTHPSVWHDPFTRVTRLIHICDTIYPYVWQNSFICATISFICVTWFFYKCGVTHSIQWHDSYICVRAERKEAIVKWCVNLRLSIHVTWVIIFCASPKNVDVIHKKRIFHSVTWLMYMWYKENVDVIQKKWTLWKYDIVSIRNTGHCILCKQTGKNGV